MRSHTVTAGFWTQTCVASLLRNPPYADGYNVDIVVVDNSPWSPAIRGITDTVLGYGVTVVPNPKSNKFHASALDCMVEYYEFDYLMALETDVLALRPTWLQWFVDQMRKTDFAVGMFHHEQFVNPSCTLYRGDVLREMDKFCKGKGYITSGKNDGKLYKVPEDELRWGPNFESTALLDHNLHNAENPAEVLRNMKEWIGGPFAEKRGFHEGTTLMEPWSGQLKGPGWMEPGQQLHHWATQAGFTYTVCPTVTTTVDNVPVQTMYGYWGDKEKSQGYPPSCRMGCGDRGHDHQRQLEAVEMFGNAQTAHLWGGTRALDILKHDVTCQFVKANTPKWLAREARFWRSVVPQCVQAQTIDLIRRYGWHYTGQGSDHVSDRDREAVEYVRTCYRDGGVEW